MIHEPEAGASNERTALAWQRTALSIIAAAAVVARLTHGTLGSAALVAPLVVVPLAAWVFLHSRLRYRQRNSRASGELPDSGRPAAFLALSVGLVVASELVAIVK